MPIIKVINSRANLSTALNYILRKSEESKSLNCRTESALEEMLITKSFYGQEGGKQYLHLALSFPPGEGTPEDVMKCALQFVKREPKLQGHETVIGVHVDRDHLHAHILANSVSIATGKKLHTSKKDLEAMKALQNEICAELGYSAPEKVRKALEVGQVQDPWTYKLLQARENDKPVNSWIYDLAEKIVLAKSRARSRAEYVQILEGQGVTVSESETKKHVCYIIKEEEGEHKIRDSRLKKVLGLECGKEAISELEDSDRVGRGEGRGGKTLCFSDGTEGCSAGAEERDLVLKRRERETERREREARLRERGACALAPDKVHGASQSKKRNKSGRVRTIDD